MATTATNKQPLLIDRIFHSAKNVTTQKTGSANRFALSGNSCQVLVDCTANDGGIVEDIYLIPIAESAAAVRISLYLAPMNDTLRENNDNVIFVGEVGFDTVVAADLGVRRHMNTMPLTLAPTPSAVPTNDASTSAPVIYQRQAAQFQCMYIPKGYALWFGRQTDSSADLVKGTSAPIIGATGGFY